MATKLTDDQVAEVMAQIEAADILELSCTHFGPEDSTTTESVRFRDGGDSWVLRYFDWNEGDMPYTEFAKSKMRQMRIKENVITITDFEKSDVTITLFSKERKLIKHPTKCPIH